MARQRRFGAVLGIRTERLGWGSRDEYGTVWHPMPHDLAIVLEILGEVPELRWAHVEQRSGDAATGATASPRRRPVGRAPGVVAPPRLRRVQLVCSDAVVGLDDGYADALTIATGPLLQGDRRARPAPRADRHRDAAAGGADGVHGVPAVGAQRPSPTWPLP